jgi:copper chaperone
METVILKIAGMSCGGCVRHVSRALEAVPGTRVEEVKVGAAKVAMDSQKTTRSALAQAVCGAGYEVVE